MAKVVGIRGFLTSKILQKDIVHKFNGAFRFSAVSTQAVIS